MKTRKFWPLDMDPEGQIYDNPAWDLPCFRPKPSSRKIVNRLTHAERRVSDV
jgi:hypothetical protein